MSACPRPSGGVAWIVPTHRPHFVYARRLLRGVRDHGLDVDLHFVLGDRAEASEFAAELGNEPGCELLVADELLPAGRLAAYLATGSIINVKKYVALHHLRERYPVLCALDSEVTVLRPGDVRESHALRVGRRAYPAHVVRAPLLRQVVQAPARLFGLRAEDRIMREVTDGGRLYAWFEDVPTYDAEGLGEMLERLGALHDVTALCDRLSWFDFDHIVFQYFNCVFRDWRLEDQGWPACTGSAAEWELWRGATSAERERAREFGARWRPSWIGDPELADVVPSAFLVFHADRLHPPAGAPARERSLAVA